MASPSASTFVLNGSNGDSNFSFSINVANDSDDLYFRLEGPIGNSWIAVGAGDSMAGSLMFVVYAAQAAGSEFILLSEPTQLGDGCSCNGWLTLYDNRCDPQPATRKVSV